MLIKLGYDNPDCTRRQMGEKFGSDLNIFGHVGKITWKQSPDSVVTQNYLEGVISEIKDSFGWSILMDITGLTEPSRNALKTACSRLRTNPVYHVAAKNELTSSGRVLDIKRTHIVPESAVAKSFTPIPPNKAIAVVRDFETGDIFVFVNNGTVVWNTSKDIEASYTLFKTGICSSQFQRIEFVETEDLGDTEGHIVMPKFGAVSYISQKYRRGQYRATIQVVGVSNE